MKPEYYFELLEAALRNDKIQILESVQNAYVDAYQKKNKKLIERLQYCKDLICKDMIDGDNLVISQYTRLLWKGND